MEKLNIYFDNAATTPPINFGGLCGVENIFGNPSSPHGLGRGAERVLISARAEMAGFLGFRENEVIFTAGGTEANNLAILGFALANKRQNLSVFAQPWEHPSVLEPIKHAAELGLCEAVIAPLAPFAPGNTPLAPFSPGNAPQLASSSRGLRMVCLSHVSHETGDINDIAKLAAELKAENPQTVVHVDGVQGFCKEKTDLSAVDMYTFSAHKFHGPGGVGGLFRRENVRLVPILRGGEQERGLRAGTENVAGITQMVSAARQLAAAQEENHALVAAVKAELAALIHELPDVYINSMGGEVSPYILNMSFLGIKGETLVHLLSEKGIYASMGAACRSRKKQKSLLETMGFSKERAESAVRFSFSHSNTVEEARAAKEIIIANVAQMRRVLGRR